MDGIAEQLAVALLIGNINIGGIKRWNARPIYSFKSVPRPKQGEGLGKGQ